MIAKNNANKKNAILYYIMLLFSFVGYIIIISFSVSLNAAIWYFTLLVSVVYLVKVLPRTGRVWFDTSLFNQLGFCNITY